MQPLTAPASAPAPHTRVQRKRQLSCTAAIVALDSGGCGASSTQGSVFGLPHTRRGMAFWGLGFRELGLTRSDIPVLVLPSVCLSRPLLLPSTVDHHLHKQPVQPNVQHSQTPPADAPLKGVAAGVSSHAAVSRAGRGIAAGVCTQSLNNSLPTDHTPQHPKTSLPVETRNPYQNQHPRSTELVAGRERLKRGSAPAWRAPGCRPRRRRPGRPCPF